MRVKSRIIKHDNHYFKTFDFRLELRYWMVAAGEVEFLYLIEGLWVYVYIIKRQKKQVCLNLMLKDKRKDEKKKQ